MSAQSPRIQEDAKAHALVQEFLEQKEREEPAESTTGRFAHGKIVGIAVMSVVCAAAWLAPYPTGAANTAPDPLTAAAGARLTIFLTGARVQEFKARHKRLPTTLVEAGVTEPSIEYSKGIDTSFTLETTISGQRIVFDSNKDPRSMLGSAVSTIERKGH